MTHDLAAQKAETTAVLGDLSAKHNLPDVADVEYFLVPAHGDANWEPLAQALTEAGYLCEYFQAELAEEADYLLATLPDQPITTVGIWIGEETATRMALEHGFRPDGWGLVG